MPILRASTAYDPLHGLLDALAIEAGELSRSADELQHLFGRLMDMAVPAPANALEQAQALDGLVQRLDGLRTFLAGLAAMGLEDLPADIAQVAARLHLTNQARRFACGASETREKVKAGDYDPL